MKLIMLTLRTSYNRIAFNCDKIEAISDMSIYTSIFVGGEEFQVMEKFEVVTSTLDKIISSL